VRLFVLSTWYSCLMITASSANFIPLIVVRAVNRKSEQMFSELFAFFALFLIPSATFSYV
jgi:hypothetical protein